jgi:hypothetical protein
MVTTMATVTAMATRPSAPAKSVYFLANRGARTLYTTVLVAAGCALLWLGLANATSLVLGKKNPALAMRLGFTSAQTKATLALSIVTNNPTAKRLAEARQLAQTALRREPINATAAVVLGLIATMENRAALGRKLVGYSEHVSRRNSVAQLWMIEDQVSRGDVAGALVHYDRAMRVSPELRPTLIPILVQAAADPAVARPLAAILAGRPLWWPDALGPIIYRGSVPAITLPIVLQQVKLRPSNDQERTFLIAAMRRLVDAGAFRQADALYRTTGGRPPVGDNLVYDGEFDAARYLPPFEWDLHSEGGFSATVQPRAGGGRALYLSVDQEHAGELARQLLQLKPGRYRFSALAGNIVGDTFERPQVKLLCAVADSRVVLDLHLGVAGEDGAPSQADFQVPASSCSAQWLTIASGGSEQSPQSDPWIGRIVVQLLS